MTVRIGVLQRYRVDRADGRAADGSLGLVVLVLKSTKHPEIATAISRSDAMRISIELAEAAKEVQGEIDRGD